MSAGSLVLVGGPDSGKTNYIARLWLAFRARRGALLTDKLPTDLQYVNDAARHLMQGVFAPRSERNMEDGRRDFVLDVRPADGSRPPAALTVPDITGELWKRAVLTYELPREWMDALEAASCAILFVRAHSKLNHQPMDWVVARDVLRMGELSDEPVDEDDDLESPVGEAASGGDAGQDYETSDLEEEDETFLKGERLPAQVTFCELFRYLEFFMSARSDGRRPRVAVVVTAWDMLDAESRAAGPMAYLKAQFPLFAGRLIDSDRLEVEVFGVSVVGGDLKHDPVFRASVLGRDVADLGYAARLEEGVVVENPDVMLPLAWALGR